MITIGIDKEIVLTRDKLVLAILRYKGAKRLAKDTSSSSSWSYWMSECKKDKRELAILANWLHTLLWITGKTKVVARDLGFTAKDILETKAKFPLDNLYKSPCLLVSQSC